MQLLMSSFFFISIDFESFSRIKIFHNYTVFHYFKLCCVTTLGTLNKRRSLKASGLLTQVNYSEKCTLGSEMKVFEQSYRQTEIFCTTHCVAYHKENINQDRADDNSFILTSGGEILTKQFCNEIKKITVKSIH